MSKPSWELPEGTTRADVRGHESLNSAPNAPRKNVPTLVLLPGMDGSGVFFRDFIAALGPLVRTVVVAYPPDRALDYAALEAIAHQSIPADQPFILVGESFSGPIAIGLAALWPERLAGLVLVCSFARSPVALPKPFGTWLSFMPFWKVPVWASARFLLGKWWTPALSEQLGQSIAHLLPAVWRARIRAVFEVDVERALREVRVPILYLRATHDRVVPPWAAEHIRRCVPAVRIVDIDGPHFLLQVNPADCVQALHAFALAEGT